MAFVEIQWKKQIKTPPKKQKTKYQRDVHKFRGKKKSYSQIEKKMDERGRKYTWESWD